MINEPWDLFKYFAAVSRVRILSSYIFSISIAFIPDKLGAISEITSPNEPIFELMRSMLSISSMLFWKKYTPSTASISNISIA